jgi:hypothetical protein
VGSLCLPVNPLRLMSESTGPLLDRLATTLQDIAEALSNRDPAAALANAVLEETSNLSAQHRRQARMTAVDLLLASGFERSRAQQVVRTADAERLER